MATIPETMIHIKTGDTVHEFYEINKDIANALNMLLKTYVEGHSDMSYAEFKNEKMIHFSK